MLVNLFQNFNWHIATGQRIFQDIVKCFPNFEQKKTLVFSVYVIVMVKWLKCYWLQSKVTFNIFYLNTANCYVWFLASVNGTKTSLQMTWFFLAQREMSKARPAVGENVWSVMHLLYWFLDIRIQCLNYNWLVSLPFYWDHWFVSSGSLYRANRFCGVGMSKCHYEGKKDRDELCR